MEKFTKLKRFRRTFESTQISEERYLELQAETIRLKKEILDKDEQHKLIVVKLHRAQEAAKKNLRTGVEQGLQTSRDKNAVMVMLLQQSNAEEKIYELELKIREGHKDTQKYLEYSRRAKAEAESLKKRLEMSTQAVRRTRAPTPLDVSRRYEKMVKKLKNQISTLQEENKDLHNRMKDGLECSKPPTEACLRMISQLAGLANSQTKMVGHHKQQDSLNNLVSKIEMNEGYTQRRMLPSSLDTIECKFQEQHEVECGEDSSGSLQIRAQLMKTSEHLGRMKKKHHQISDELQQLKINHSKCLQKLQDTYNELTQERKVRQELEIEKKQIYGELITAEHLKASLQQLRQQNVQLENENAELLNAALNVPRTNFVEIKSLREQLVDELKQRNLAMANAAKLSIQLADCKRDLARFAVIEANWQYLKAELEVANKSATTENLKVTELQATNKLLQKHVKELQSKQAEIPEQLNVIYDM